MSVKTVKYDDNFFVQVKVGPYRLAGVGANKEWVGTFACPCGDTHEIRERYHKADVSELQSVSKRFPCGFVVTVPLPWAESKVSPRYINTIRGRKRVNF